MRAFLLASATATTSFGFLPSMRASQEPAGAPLRAAQLTTATAPQISRRRRSRWPIFVVPPSRPASGLGELAHLGVNALAVRGYPCVAVFHASDSAPELRYKKARSFQRPVLGA